MAKELTKKRNNRNIKDIGLRGIEVKAKFYSCGIGSSITCPAARTPCWR